MFLKSRKHFSISLDGFGVRFRLDWNHSDIFARIVLSVHPGNFGGNAHRDTRCHSMQNLAGLFTGK